jgi:hypothetical protein
VKILILIDRPHWSYHTIAKGIVKYNTDSELQIDILPAKNNGAEIERRQQGYDVVFPMAWQLALEEKKRFFSGKAYGPRWPFLPEQRIVTGIHSHRAWDNDRTTPEHLPLPPQALIEALSKCRGVNVVSRRLYGLFQQAGLRNLMLTEPGVDTEVFKPSAPIHMDPSK